MEEMKFAGNGGRPGRERQGRSSSVQRCEEVGTLRSATRGARGLAARVAEPGNRASAGRVKIAPTRKIAMGDPRSIRWLGTDVPGRREVVYVPGMGPGKDRDARIAPRNWNVLTEEVTWDS